MRALALALLCAANTQAASVHLQTIEHVATFDEIPATKQVIYSGNVDFGSHQWIVEYEDSDLGVTVWEASDADIRAWQRQARVVPNHAPQTHTLIIGELPNRVLFTSPGTIPMNLDTTASDGDSFVTYTKMAHAYVFVPTGLEMELSPFVEVGGNWQVTQTVRVYGAVPEPECAYLVTCAYCVGLFVLRRDAGRG